MTEQTVACTACDSTQTRKDPFYYQWDGRKYWIQRCSSCTHQFVHPPISSEQQARIYDDQYFAAGGDWAVGHFDGTGYHDATDSLLSEADEVLEMVPRRSGRLMDVGCAGGVFLQRARSVGFDVMGIELNPSQASAARARFALNVLNVRIEDAPNDLGPFDVVTILDVLEHVPAPLQALRKISGWMVEGSHLMIRGPMCDSPLARAKERARRLLNLSKQLPGYPLDANMFNSRSLTRMLELAGFSVIRTRGDYEFRNVLARKTND